MRLCTRPSQTAMHMAATCSGATESFTRPARISLRTASMNAWNGPKRRFVRSSSRTCDIDASRHFTCVFINMKNALPFGSSTINSAFFTIMFAIAGNESSSLGINSEICRWNLASISSTSATSSTSLDSKCQYTAPFVIFRRAAMSLKVVWS